MLQHLAKTALQTILKKLKKQKTTLGHNHVQALCRVYVGICRQLGDLEKARLFCYSLLKEGMICLCLFFYGGKHLTHYVPAESFSVMLIAFRCFMGSDSLTK